MLAGCGNQASPLGDVSPRDAGAIGGASASGRTAVLGGATNNLSSDRTPTGPTASGGATSTRASGGAATSVGGTLAIETSSQAIGGSLGCGGTLTLGSITPAELHDELAQGSRTFLLVNVHVPVSGHIPGTDADIDYRNVAAIEQLLRADTSQPVVIHCMSHAMSDIAGPELVSDGYCHVRALLGGMSAWSRAGYAVDP